MPAAAGAADSMNWLGKRQPEHYGLDPGPTAQCVIIGLGVHGYILGLEAALHLISQKAG
jgi:3-dehydroquinate dehydratase